MIKPEAFNYYSTYLIGKEASNRGIKVKKIFRKGPLAKTSALILKYDNHEETIIGQRISNIDSIAFWIQRNKALAKYFFKKAGISIAPGDVFYITNIKEIIRYCKTIGYPVVIKRLDGTHGDEVFMNINSDFEVKKTLKQFRKGIKRKVLIEKQYEGSEYRIFATKNKFVAAVQRRPANVVGDGINSIKKLIALKNNDPRRGEGHEKSLVKIKIDETVKTFLKRQKKSLEYIPKKDEQVFLRANSNLSTGGDSVDVTSLLHPSVKELAVKTIQAIPGLAYGGIDYMTKDITKKPTKNNYIIIEVNDSPMISMHHIPYQGASRDVAKEIIDLLFPETSQQI